MASTVWEIDNGNERIATITLSNDELNFMSTQGLCKMIDERIGTKLPVLIISPRRAPKYADTTAKR